MRYKTLPTHLVQYTNLNSFQITEDRITSSEQLKIITEYTSVVYKNTFNTISIKEYNFTCYQVWVHNFVSYARGTLTGLVTEECWGEAIGYGETYFRNSYFVLFISYYYRQLDMEIRTWGIHILYSSPAITTVLISWRIRRAGNEACKRAIIYRKGTTLNIFDDIKVDLKQIWYQDMEQIHGSI
jgi:hypothetical protein